MDDGQQQGKRTGAEGRILLLDTCGAEASVALAEGAAIVGRATLPGRSASELLIPGIREEMERLGWRVRDLSVVAVVRGPGSFTGVRVGLSVAKGVAEGGGMPLVGLSRLEILAAKAGVGNGRGVLEAGRGQCFWARLAGGLAVDEGVTEWETFRETDEVGARDDDAGRSEQEVVACEETDLPRLGEGQLEDRRIRVVAVSGLRAEDGLEIARRAIGLGAFADPVGLDALYLRRTGEELLARQAAHREARRGQG